MQTEFNNTLKGSYNMIKWDLFRDGRMMVQHLQMSQCDTSLKVNDKNLMIILIDAEQAFDKIQHPFMIKSQQTGYRGNIPKHNKNCI